MKYFLVIKIISWYILFFLQICVLSITFVIFKIKLNVVLLRRIKTHWQVIFGNTKKRMPEKERVLAIYHHRGFVCISSWFLKQTQKFWNLYENKNVYTCIASFKHKILILFVDIIMLIYNDISISNFYTFWKIWKRVKIGLA